MCVCVCFFSHLFWTSSSSGVPAGVTQKEGHTGFLIHLPSAVRALIFLARRIQPFLSLVDRGSRILCTNIPIVLHLLGDFLLIFSVRKNPSLPGFELTSQRVRRLRGYYQLSYRGDRHFVYESQKEKGEGLEAICPDLYIQGGGGGGGGLKRGMDTETQKTG